MLRREDGGLEATGQQERGRGGAAGVAVGRYGEGR